MKIKILNLTKENLKDTPEWKNHPFSCKYCIYWEFPELCIDPLKEEKQEMFLKKLQWLQKTHKIFGNCGKIAYISNKAVAYAQYAPPELLPNSKNYQAGPPNKDAVLISCLFIPQKEFQHLGIGSQVLQNIIHELKERKIKAIETFARKNNPANPSGPVAFYLKNRFKIIKDDVEFPLLRLALSVY